MQACSAYGAAAERAFDAMSDGVLTSAGCGRAQVVRVYKIDQKHTNAVRENGSEELFIHRTNEFIRDIHDATSLAGYVVYCRAIIY